MSAEPKKNNYDEIIKISTVAACYCMVLCEIGPKEIVVKPLFSLMYASSMGSLYLMVSKFILSGFPRKVRFAVPLVIFYHCYQTLKIKSL